jgi:aryl-alcohol dehydrogenase-like predicted oxidoreductase
MAFDGIGGEESFLRSLERLRTDQVDLLQVHGMNGTEQLVPLMVEWKKEGKVRYIGVTSSDPRQHDELIDAMRRHPLDFIQVNYSIVDRAAAEDVLPAAKEQGIAVLVNLPFGGGGVFGKVRDLELPEWAAEIDARSWAQVLLKYVVSHPAVTCAIPGSTKISHLEDNQQAARGRLPDAALRRQIEQYWDALG